MKSNASLVYSLALVVGDFLALVLAFITAYILRVSINITDAPITQPVYARDYVVIFSALLPFWILIFALMGLYQNSIYEKRFNELGRLFVGTAVGMLFVISWDYISLEPIFPAKLVPVLGFGLAFVYLAVFRNLARWARARLFRYDIGVTNVLIVGNTKIATELAESLADWRRSGYRIIGLVGHASGTAKKFPNLPVFESFEKAVKKLRTSDIHSIVQTELYSGGDRNNEILEFAQTHHIAYRFIPGNSELFVGNIDVELFRASIPVIAVHQTALFGWGRIVKRLFDLVLGLPLLIIALPLMILIAPLNLLSGNGIFFRQSRLTRFNQKFRVFKFQTLKNEYNNLTPEEAFAKMGKPELAKQYRANGDYLPDDPRVGRFGRFLRKTSLDELPQLINVAKGDLSLVGPRALVPEELSLHEKKHAILSVKSGLTGLAQVSGRRSIDFEERRQLDVYYVQNWSFWLDLVILIKTIRVVFSGRGAA
jgi:exopolysaccharide biosynthesis polyprenyl glycosylphosphotransferase